MPAQRRIRRENALRSSSSHGADAGFSIDRRIFRVVPSLFLSCSLPPFLLFLLVHLVSLSLGPQEFG